MAPLGCRSIALDFVVHDIGDDRIAGIWRDELDVDHVVVYSIVKPGPEQ